MAGKHRHLAHAVERHPEVLTGETGGTLRRRMDSLRRWGGLRGVILVALYFGIVATTAAWVFRYLPRAEPVQDFVDRLTALSGAFTGILTLLALFLTRTLGQLEMDILAILTLESKKR